MKPINANDAPHFRVVNGSGWYRAFEMLYDIRNEGLANWQHRMLQSRLEREAFAAKMSAMKNRGNT